MTNQINKSKLFKMAWKAFRTSQMKAAKKGKQASFSNSLKWAWSVLKSESKAITVKASRETEKAIAVAVTATCVFTDQVVERLVWIPKSLMNGTTVPAWFWNKKVEELRNSFSYQGANSLEIEQA